MVASLDCIGIEFPVSKRSYKIELKNEISITVSGYDNKQAYPLYLSK